MEHDSGPFGIHKSVWQDWPCILRTVRAGLSVKHNPSAGFRNNGKKETPQRNYKRGKELKSFIGGWNIESPFDVKTMGDNLLLQILVWMLNTTSMKSWNVAKWPLVLRPDNNFFDTIPEFWYNKVLSDTFLLRKINTASMYSTQKHTDNHTATEHNTWNIHTYLNSKCSLNTNSHTIILLTNHSFYHTYNSFWQSQHV